MPYPFKIPMLYFKSCISYPCFHYDGDKRVENPINRGRAMFYQYHTIINYIQGNISKWGGDSTYAKGPTFSQSCNLDETI